MRRYRKKDIQQALETLTEANHIIAKAAEHNPQKALEALVQCQEVAILTGNYLETQKERYASLTVMLEEYCEEIYQMSKNISDASQFRKLSARVAELLKRIQKAAARDLKDKKEVIFLPYKASMWDSLESVWKAADGDEETDAYVIPIPYYDKNPDGSFREMHYEGDQYPDYVPVTHYSEYDIEERRPDAIYIHNPYDNANYVTSVEPFYYSENLRRFTEKLVYIPYFVLGEIDPGDQAAVEKMAHFVTVPAVIHADKVIVQSEDMRQIYINVLSVELGKHTEKYWEEKIFGTGSPKFDRVTEARAKSVQIPQEWRSKLFRQNGTKKRVVLYNTGVSALLQYSDHYIAKMRSVFAAFEKYQENIALIWRPHPLIEATIASMRPLLWREYQKAAAEYQDAGWGVYDDTADLDRAIALSDAYYGDDSSVIQLCRRANISVMIQNVEILD